MYFNKKHSIIYIADVIQYMRQLNIYALDTTSPGKRYCGVYENLIKLMYY